MRQHLLSILHTHTHKTTIFINILSGMRVILCCTSKKYRHISGKCHFSYRPVNIRVFIYGMVSASGYPGTHITINLAISQFYQKDLWNDCDFLCQVYSVCYDIIKVSPNNGPNHSFFLKLYHYFVYLSSQFIMTWQKYHNQIPSWVVSKCAFLILRSRHRRGGYLGIIYRSTNQLYLNVRHDSISQVGEIRELKVIVSYAELSTTGSVTALNLKHVLE